MNECPRCNGTVYTMSPQWANGISVLHCSICTWYGDSEGRPIVVDTEELKDTFRGATLSEQVFPEFKQMDPAQAALLRARIISYGSDMWFDGLKQGLLLGVQDGKVRNKQ